MTMPHISKNKQNYIKIFKLFFFKKHRISESQNNQGSFLTHSNVLCILLEGFLSKYSLRDPGC